MPSLENRRLLIVEDDYILADDLARRLRVTGAEIIGPVPTEERAMTMLRSERPDAVVLDINLRGRMAFSVADTLVERGIPFVFATGYDGDTIPDRFAHVACMQKPYDIGGLLDMLERVVNPSEPGRAT